MCLLRAVLPAVGRAEIVRCGCRHPPRQLSRRYSDMPSAPPPPNSTNWPLQHAADPSASECTAFHHVIDAPSALDSFGGISPVGMMENLLGILHYNAGLPWWASVVALGVLTKTLAFPFFVQTQQAMALSQLHKSKLADWNETVQNLYQKGQRAAYMTERKKLMEWRAKAGFPSTFKSVRNAAMMIAVSLSAFLAVQNLCSLEGLHSLAVERFGWMTLSAPDPTLVLPLLSTLLLMGNIGLSFSFGSSQSLAAAIPPGMRVVLYSLTFGSLYFTKNMNAGIMLYFTTVNLLNIFQTLGIRVPFIRQRLNIIPLDKIKSNNLFAGANPGLSFSKLVRTKISSANLRKNSQREALPSVAPPRLIKNLERLAAPTKEGLNFK